MARLPVPRIGGRGRLPRTIREPISPDYSGARKFEALQDMMRIGAQAYMDWGVAKERDAAEEARLVREEDRVQREEGDKFIDTVERFREIYDELPPGAFKELFGEHGQFAYDSLSRTQKARIEPLLYGTYLSPTAKTMRDFHKKTPHPGPNPFNEEPGKNPLGWAMHEGRVVNWKRMMRAASKLPPGPELKTIAVTDEIYAHWDKGGEVPDLINVHEEKLNEMTSKLPGNPTASMVMANGGVWPLMEKETFKFGYQTFQRQKMLNIVTNEAYYEPRATKDAPSGLELTGDDTPPDMTDHEKVPDVGIEFASYLGMEVDEEDMVKSKAGRMFLQFQEQIDGKVDVNEALANTIGKELRDFTFRYVPVKGPARKRFLGLYTSQWKGGVIVAIPGTRTSLPGKGNTIVPVFYHDKTGQHYSLKGEALGFENTAAAWAATQEGLPAGRMEQRVPSEEEHGTVGQQRFPGMEGL